jgi:hypothetical protein
MSVIEMTDAVVKVAQEEYERGFIDGMQEQMKTSVDRAVNATCRREWVGLTAKDLAEIPPSAYEGAIWADAKLREKNT